MKIVILISFFSFRPVDNTIVWFLICRICPRGREHVFLAVQVYAPPEAEPCPAC